MSAAMTRYQLLELRCVVGGILSLLFLGQPGHAETQIELACVHSNGFTVDVIVDEETSTVSVNGTRLRAIIDHNSISFKQQADDGTTYYQRISRSTGVMVVQYGDTSRMERYDCSRAQRRF
jgi:hypothetical protein